LSEEKIERLEKKVQSLEKEVKDLRNRCVIREEPEVTVSYEELEEEDEEPEPATNQTEAPTGDTE
jgi:hypothetical protein